MNAQDVERSGYHSEEGSSRDEERVTGTEHEAALQTARRKKTILLAIIVVLALAVVLVGSLAAFKHFGRTTGDPALAGEEAGHQAANPEDMVIATTDSEGNMVLRDGNGNLLEPDENMTFLDEDGNPLDMSELGGNNGR